MPQVTQMNAVPASGSGWASRMAPGSSTGHRHDIDSVLRWTSSYVSGGGHVQPGPAQPSLPISRDGREMELE